MSDSFKGAYAAANWELKKAQGDVVDARALTVRGDVSGAADLLEAVLSQIARARDHIAAMSVAHYDSSSAPVPVPVPKHRAPGEPPPFWGPDPMDDPPR